MYNVQTMLSALRDFCLHFLDSFQKKHITTLQLTQHIPHTLFESVKKVITNKHTSTSLFSVNCNLNRNVSN